MKIIYSIGTSTRTLDDFIRILRELGVRNAVDVRRFPSSKRFPHFSRKPLEEALRNFEIKYFYLGDRLGGFRDCPYTLYVKTDEFKEGLTQLESLAKKDTSIFFCCERLYFRCHRRFIAQALTERGWIVHHVLDLKRTIVEKDNLIGSEELNLRS